MNVVRRKVIKHHAQKVIIVMPAYYADRTIERTFGEIPKGLISEIILVDDKSRDRTVAMAKRLGITVYQHAHNIGYGGSQKTCYWEALKRKPDVVVMLHPDYQYDGSYIPKLIAPILDGSHDCMFGSRMTGNGAILGGMPRIKYTLNRLMTKIENFMLGQCLSEYMSGYRAYSREFLETVPFQRFSNDFVFDQQLMVAAVSFGFRIGEIPIKTRYHDEQSSIMYLKGAKFLLETLWCLVRYRLHVGIRWPSDLFMS
jgi:glycosyltransferase involved in cell wall biosynthesis